MTMMQHQENRYIGLDVYGATIAVAIAEEDGPPTSYGSIANDPSAGRKLMTRLGGPEVRLRVAYEAGPTGYAVQRQLATMNVECMVIAPSLIPVRAGDKVKTDRRDALKPTRLLRSGDLTAVWVPDAAHEALPSLVRSRADAKADQLRAKHRLSKFLLRQGCKPPVGVRRCVTFNGCGNNCFGSCAAISGLPPRPPYCAWLWSISSSQCLAWYPSPPT